MNTKEKWLWGYKVLRSLLFTTVLFIAALFLGIYIMLSLPFVQNKIRDIATEQLSLYFESKVEIGDVDIRPFNEVIIKDFNLYEPDGDRRCVHADEVGGGISIWNLIVNRSIVVTYAEVIGLKAEIRQNEKYAPFNIQFILDAFAPKDPNNPPTKFNLQIRNIVIRKSSASLDLAWKETTGKDRIDFNHLTVTALNADVELPRLSNDRITVDLRRLAFRVNSLLDIKCLTFLAEIDRGDISIRDFRLMLNNSEITLNDLNFPLSHFDGNMERMFKTSEFSIAINANPIIPSEFSGFFPPLAAIKSPFKLIMNANGNSDKIELRELSLINGTEDFNLNVESTTLTKSGEKLSDLKLGRFSLHAGVPIMEKINSFLPSTVNQNIRHIISNAGIVDLELTGAGSLQKQIAEAKVRLSSGYGPLNLEGKVQMYDNSIGIEGRTGSEGLSVGKITDNNNFGSVAFEVEGKVVVDKAFSRKGTSSGLEDIDRINMVLPEGYLDIHIDRAEIKGEEFRAIQLNLKKDPSITILNIESRDPDWDLDLETTIQPAANATTTSLHADLNRVKPSVFLKSGRFANYIFTSGIDIDLIGNRLDNLAGTVNIDNFDAISINGDDRLSLSSLSISGIFNKSDHIRQYKIDSDWFAGQINGNFLPSELPGRIKDTIRGLTKETTRANRSYNDTHTCDLQYDFTIFPEQSWMRFFNIPIQLLYPARISGEYASKDNMLTFDMSAPYINQGRDKLIQHTRLGLKVQNGLGTADFFSSIPTKKGILDLDVDVIAENGKIDLDLGFNREKKGAFYGDLNLSAKILTGHSPAFGHIDGVIYPTTLWLNGAGWKIDEASLFYTPKRIEVKDFSICHQDQYINISGVASPEKHDEVKINLNDIDLNYIFDTLNIDYVSFGGFASGEAIGRALLSGKPEAFTRNLSVKDLSYNHSVLGDGELYGDFDAVSKRIGIKANVTEESRNVANIDGGIWLGRDSLSFGIEADKVRIGFLQSFMKAFSSHVSGRASGKALLYGTFKDIDLWGRLFADTISLKVDYTNVMYAGRDSVKIDPGCITIPTFRLSDQFGHSAYLQGNLTHEYFHNPVFRFNVTGADNLLVYDTDATMNSIWYGRIFGDGGGEITGHPGFVGIMADMTTCPGSNFTFVLSDEQEATEYKFLTFTDHKRAIREEEERQADRVDSVADEIVAAFNKQIAEQQASETALVMDLRATVTPAAALTLIMDPAAGDKITAIGEGAMNMSYNSESNDLKMYGKYTLQQGTYNFSLQDLILRDFTIRPGSSISFNGDPMNGLLDIKAAYRVNTNLADLDKSFSTDRDLNRTNVPVDATLIVTGEMTEPDISFDVEFPTLNDEVSQKVRSIISSEDMMNRQIIYLLALNRFYTPEYMGTSSTGGEWASVASSTISSQLTNILGQLTDKVNIMPSLRSDKGDFSDLEVDLALSSRLFNNRLLINGNFGYRDRNTSSTTFIGDFDIEYLLRRNGNFRLKAYNHFNDQNYYLKSALTTQGIGVIFRKDFDRLFRRKRKLTR